MDNLISEIMHNEHNRINSILDEFEKINRINMSDSKIIFYKFESEIKKHFSIEENSIFVLNQSIMDENISNIFDLMAQHGAIINLTSTIKIAFENNLVSDISQLKEILFMHSNFEESAFYPKLDKKLNNDEKQAIVNKIKSAELR